MAAQDFVVESVKEMGWEPDTYGNVVYGVKFNGVLEGALIRKQKRPEIGDKVYGHLEQTKAGKGQWFRPDKRPEDAKDIEQTELPPTDDLHTLLKQLNEKMDTLTSMIIDMGVKLEGEPDSEDVLDD